MTWARIADDYYDHPKILAAGPAAERLWVRGIAYCNRYLTDGVLQLAAVRRLADDQGAARLRPGRVRTQREHQMSNETRWICTESRTPLVAIDSDGARCSGNATHWHRRTARGFTGARPSPAQRYRDVELDELPSLAAASDRAEGGD